MKRYKVTAYALNHVWYREEWIIEAESQEDAIIKAELQEGDLIGEGKGDVETCRASFDFDHIEELEVDHDSPLLYQLRIDKEGA